MTMHKMARLKIDDEVAGEPFAQPEESGWQFGRLFRVEDANGTVWCETSDYGDALRRTRPGDKLFCLYVKTQEQWVEQEIEFFEMESEWR